MGTEVMKCEQKIFQLVFGVNVPPITIVNTKNQQNHLIHFLVTLAHGKFAIGSLDEIEISCDLID